MSHSASGSTPILQYRLGMAVPHTHLFQVELTVPAHAGDHVDLALPAWTPGAYKIVDNARNLRDVRIVDADGQMVAWERRDFHTWRVHHRGRAFTVSYAVYADKMQIHQAQLNAQHAFVNGCTVFLGPVEHPNWPCELVVEPPGEWRVATGLAALGTNRFAAANYDELIDAPLEIGTFEGASFSVEGVEYRIIWNGPEPMDRARLIDGLRRLVEAEIQFWGSTPYTNYTFIYNVTTDGFLNGLEHRNSTAIQGNINLITNARGLFALSAHELFHSWNIKRLRPIGLGPFDYSRPAHTTALWVVEGLTEYYTELMCLRAGVSTPEDFLKGIADNLVSLERSPGRQFTTLEQASYITWNFGDDRWNGAINYYLKGALVGMALDLEIRQRTGNQHTLDEVMRLMWERYGEADVPYDPEVIEQVAEEVAQSSLSGFFDHHLRTTAETDWSAILAQAGFSLQVVHENASLQCQTVAKDGGLVIETVRAQGSAESAGLMVGDVIVSMDAMRATDATATKVIAGHRPGDQVVIHYFRNDCLRETTVTLQGDRTYALRALPQATPLALQIQDSWLAPMKAPAALGAV